MTTIGLARATLCMILLVGGVIAVAPTPAGAQDTLASIRGAIVDSATGRPIHYVRVFLEGSDREYQTDPSGQFTVPNLGLGPHELTLAHQAYRSRGFRFTITEELLGPVDIGVLGLAPIPTFRITVRGRVLDVNTGEPIADAAININSDVAIETDEDGRFEVQGYEVREGTQPVYVRRIGYESMTYPVRATGDRFDFDLDLRLQPLAVRLDDIVVEGRPVPRKLDAFFRRRAQGDGQYLTPWEIEKIPAGHVTDVLRQMRGILITPGQYPSQNLVRTVRGCREPPRLYVDNIEVRGSNFNVVSHLDVNAVEVYLSPTTTPLQFQRNDADLSCGTVVIWTR